MNSKIFISKIYAPGRALRLGVLDGLDLALLLLETKSVAFPARVPKVRVLSGVTMVACPCRIRVRRAREILEEVIVTKRPNRPQFALLLTGLANGDG